MGGKEIPSSMRAAQVTAINKSYEIREVETPRELGDHDLLVKTVVASLCHTDVMVIEGTMQPVKDLPITGSHEGTGIVVAVGPKVDNFKVGDRVMSGGILDGCGECDQCQGPNDWHQYCMSLGGSMGTTADGAFADYHKTDSRTTCLIPPGVSFAEAAPLGCAGRTIFRSILVSGIKEGQWLAILGAGGGLGHLGVQFALAMGVNVIAVEGRDEGLQVCRDVGAKHVLDARDGKDSVVRQVQSLTGGRGVDVAITASAHSTSAALACAMMRIHGTMVQAAAADPFTVDFFDLIFKDITIKSTLYAGRDVSQQMIEAYARHGIKVQTNLFFGLDKTPDMVDALHSGKMKGKAVCVVDKEAFDNDEARRSGTK